MSFNADLTGCAKLVERADPLRFRVAMAAPVAARRVLFPLYAFNVEVARAPWVTQEAMIAEMRLQWWRDVCSEIASGGPVRRHEVATPLSNVLLPEDALLLDELAEARRWDIYKDAFEDVAHFDQHIDRTAGHLMWVAARRLGQADEQTVRNAAYATGVAAWFHAIPALEASGRIPLLDGSAAGVRALAEKALARLSDSRANRRLVSPAARPALFAIDATEKTLKAARDTPSTVATGQLPSLQGAGLPLRVMTGRW